MGTVIPVLKKPTLNASMPENYRPITLSSTHAKMVEMFLISDSSDLEQHGELLLGVHY